MENYKLKLKIGANEFEAEGPPEVVQAQFNAFKEMILEAAELARAFPHVTGAAPLAPSLGAAFSSPVAAAPVALDQKEAPRKDLGLLVHDESLNRIMRVDDRVVSLTVNARSLDDAVLLIVFGQKMLRGNDSVTGAEVMSGLTVSGVRVPRADRLLGKAGELGDVIVLGIGRAKRYRLTNAGMNKARSIAGELIATVA